LLGKIAGKAEVKLLILSARSRVATHGEEGKNGWAKLSKPVKWRSFAASAKAQKSELSLTRWASSAHSFRPCRAGMLGSVRKESAASSACHRTTDHTL